MVHYFTAACIRRLLRDCEEAGITGLVARADAFIMRMLLEHWDAGGTIRWIAQTAPEHRDAAQNIRAAVHAGASAVYLHGGEADRLFEQGDAAEVGRLVNLIADTGLPTGIAAHVPDNHRRAQDMGLPLDFHMVCLYNLTGYRGATGAAPEERYEAQDRVAALRLIRDLARPVVAYKVYAAGRLGPAEAFADLGASLRPHDGVCVGMFPPDSDDIVGDNVRAVAGLPTAPR
jgi:hypothetical protein